MHVFYEFFPILLFFLAFKFYDMYVATVVGIASTSLQVIGSRYWTGQWDKKQLFTLGVFVLFGSMTLYFRNPIFIKWKPTVIFWVFSLAITGSQIFTKTPLIKRLMAGVFAEKNPVPETIWKRLNLVWAIFFALLGGINLYIAYHFSDNTWVNFKFYGITIALFALSIFQAIFLARYLASVDKSS